MHWRGEKAEDEGRGFGSTGKGRYGTPRGYMLGSVTLGIVLTSLRENDKNQEAANIYKMHHAL